jgi:phospholipase C
VVANPTTIAWNTSSTVTWASTNATSCTASGSWSGVKAGSGSESTGALTANASYTLSCSGAGGTASQTAGVSVNPPTASDRIKHVVVIVQENRTPDNLFHGLPGADIANTGVNSSGQTITLQPTNLSITYDLGHTHKAFESMYDNGKMDGADLIAVTCTGTPAGCPPNPQFLYVDPAQVQPYFQLAEAFTFGDRMFQSNQGPSFPAHQYIISGTSAPSVGGTYGAFFAAENPSPTGNTGCNLAASNQTVALIDPSGVESAFIYPCFEHPTLIDNLDKAGISWRYYTPSAGSIWTGPNAIQHLSSGAEWANVIIPQSQVLTDIAAGNLAQMAWVIPDGSASDHALLNNGTGPDWVASVVNAIGASPYWSDTAIIIVWDDWGGWYDHVAPSSIYNSYEYGFRVPLIIVSPFAKKAYVSHVVHDFGSILNFIEGVFGLPSLGNVDARADDFADCFDFSQSPLGYAPVASKVGAKYFIERSKNQPPVPPDDD